MLRTLILPAVEPPYLVVEIVAGLYHLTVLPADFGDDDLEAIARAQVRANRLDACLVLGERRVLAIDAEGVERRETEVSFRLFGHWISALYAPMNGTIRSWIKRQWFHLSWRWNRKQWVRWSADRL